MGGKVTECTCLQTHPSEKEASMGAKPVILLDDGGVMNDTRLRGPQYQQERPRHLFPRRLLEQA